MLLDQMGWNESFARDFEPYVHRGYVPARVTTAYGSMFRLLTEAGEVLAESSGKLRHEAVSRSEGPAVGDWVVARLLDGEEKAIIQAVLPRQSTFSRKVAGAKAEEQVVAANVTTVLLVMGLDNDFSPRRMERYLTMAWESGAQPAIVLNKADLGGDVAARCAALAPIAAGADVHLVSALQGTGLDSLQRYLQPGATIALLGSSGVGKSTLINRLVGQELLATGEVRAWDGKGRHTTTRRELVLLPGGGMIMDTPGMRELQVWEAPEGLSSAFDDIEALARRCRFQDCTHRQEPACAVRHAVESGALDPARLENYWSIQRELQYLERRNDKLQQVAEKKRIRSATRLFNRSHRK